MKKKLIDIIVISLIGLTAVGVTGGVTLKSYLDYQKYYQENYPEIDPADYATLIDIDVKLKEGVKFYKNNKAKPLMDDFVVTGTYEPNNENENIFRQVLDPNKRPYNVTSESNFPIYGGKVTVSYKSFSKTLDINLEEVKLVDLVLEASPYQIKYQEGSKFDPTGLKLKAIYNDGSFIYLNESQYQISNKKNLVVGDNKITLTYKDGGVIKSVDISIEVVSNLEDGKLVSISCLDNVYYIEQGQNIRNAPIVVVGKYQSGNRKVLSDKYYSITSNSENAKLGRKYTLKIKSKEDQNIVSEVPLNVIDHIEGENLNNVGGTVKTETEYTYIDGKISSYQNVSFVGGFSKAVENGEKAYVNFSAYSYIDNVSSIKLRVANSYLDQIDDNYWMKPLQISSIADLYINNEKVKIDERIILPGYGPYEDYIPLYNIYSEILIKDVNLKAGNNNIVLQFKKSTLGEKTYWSETPSSMNIDYLEVISSGYSIDNKYQIKELYFSDDLSVNFGDNFSTKEVNVFAKYDNGEVEILDEDKLDISRPDGYAGIGSYEIKASLKDNPEINISKTFKINEVKFEAEDAVKSGSNKVINTTESEYSQVDQSLIGNITAVKGMDNSRTNYDGETSLTFTFKAAQGSYGLVIKCSNAYYFEDPYRTEEINLNQVIRIEINGVQRDFDVMIPRTESTDNPDVCWMTFYELNIGRINLYNGVTTIKLIARSSAPKNRWNECSIPRFDYIKLIK